MCIKFTATVERHQSLFWISIPLKVSNKDLNGIWGCGVRGVAKLFICQSGALAVNSFCVVSRPEKSNVIEYAFY